MPYEILTGPCGDKYYLTDMDYQPTEAEIYADGWQPRVHISNICDNYEPIPRGPYTTPLPEVLRGTYFILGDIDEQGRVTEKGRKEGVTQAYMDGTETEKDIYIKQAIQAERFRIANGHYYHDDRRARIILNREYPTR